MRNQLLQWLDMESVLKSNQEDSQPWRNALVEALEKLLAAAPEFLVAEQKIDGKYSFYATFGQLCCHDLFVHSLAVLMRNQRFAAVHELMAAKYYRRGQMLASICFWSGAPADLVDQEARFGLEEAGQWAQQSVADFVAAAAAAPLDALIEAELLLLVHSMLAEEDRLGNESAAGTQALFWLPWLCRDNQPAELPLFVRAETEPGVENILACLGLPRQAASVAQVKAVLGRQIARLDAQRWDGGRIVDCLRLDHWDDLHQR